VNTGENNLNRSVIAMLKMLLTQDLAKQFTLTGMGVGRQSCKLSFEETRAYKMVSSEFILIFIMIWVEAILKSPIVICNPPIYFPLESNRSAMVCLG